MSCLHVPPTENRPGRRARWSCSAFSKRSARSLALALLAPVFLPSSADALLIHWGSKGFVSNADSKGRIWDSTYSMEAGVFKAGFVPNFENRGSWVANWVPLATAAWIAGENRFAGVIDTSGSTINSGARVYFWTKNGEDLTQGPEWILLTQPSWIWPAASSETQPAIVWTTGETSVSLVVGEIGTAGNHLVSRGLGPVPVAESDWLAARFPGNPALADPSADPDGDGLSNELEYFLGSDPADASSVSKPAIKADGAATTLKLGRNPYAESTYLLEASSDLKSWRTVPHSLVTDRPDFLETSVPRDNSKPSLFFRFKLQPAAR